MIAFRWTVAGDGDVVSPVVVGEFRIVRSRGGLDSRKAGEPFQNLVIQRESLSVCVPGQLRIDREGDQMIGGKSHVQHLEISQGTNKQSGTDKQ